MIELFKIGDIVTQNNEFFSFWPKTKKIFTKIVDIDDDDIVDDDTEPPPLP